MVFTIKKELFTLHSFIGGYDKNITYLIQTHETERVWAVDASVPIHNLPGELRNKIAGIFITHTHGDHISYLDQFISENPEIDIYLFVESSYRRFDHKTILISDGDVIPVDQSQVKVLHTPGHSPGHVALYLLETEDLFSGDHVLGYGTTFDSKPRDSLTKNPWISGFFEIYPTSESPKIIFY